MGQGLASSRRVKARFPSRVFTSLILQRFASTTLPSALRVAELTSAGALRPFKMTAAIVYCPTGPGCTGSPPSGINDGAIGTGVALTGGVGPAVGEGVAAGV